MASQYKTPGVYIQEPDSFPPSIVGVETAVPCFIGYTATAVDENNRSLKLVARRIESMAEFVRFYGQGYPEKFYLTAKDKPASAAPATSQLDTDMAKLDLNAKVDRLKNLVKLLGQDMNAKTSAAENANTDAATAVTAATKAAGDAAAKVDAPDAALNKAASDAAAAAEKATAAADAAAAEAVAATAAFEAASADLTAALDAQKNADTPQVPAQAPATAAPVTNGADLSWGDVTLDGSTIYALYETGKASYNLYNSMRLFYANGGGSCFIISCGSFGNGISAGDFQDALDVCQAMNGPTMVAIPDMTLLNKQDHAKTVAATLKCCAETGDRVALLDIWGADSIKPNDSWTAVIDDFRDSVHSQVPPAHFKYGTVYFPPLVTSVVSADEIDITNFDPSGYAVLLSAINASLTANYSDPKGGLSDRGKQIQAKYVSQIGKSKPNDTVIAVGSTDLTHKQLTQGLVAGVPGFDKLLAAIAASQNVLPTCGALAGVWTTNDNESGVWNAPANTGIATMIKPALPISHQQQEDLNSPVLGLAVNAIRTFPNRGSLIWGARTLDSLSNDWRYIQVRRTMIYVEQSVKLALEAMVFKPNTPQTWVTVTSMIESFLHGLWAAGGLMGTTAAEAYRVQAGVGTTMTADDVLNGYLRVQVVLQMVHPAEFIELTFQQQMLAAS